MTGYCRNFIAGGCFFFTGSWVRIGSILWTRRAASLAQRKLRSDQEAVQQIQRLLDSTPLEIWNDQRRIGRLEPDAGVRCGSGFGTNYLP